MRSFVAPLLAILTLASPMPSDAFRAGIVEVRCLGASIDVGDEYLSVVSCSFPIQGEVSTEGPAPFHQAWRAFTGIGRCQDSRCLTWFRWDVAGTVGPLLEQGSLHYAEETVAIDLTLTGTGDTTAAHAPSVGVTLLMQRAAEGEITVAMPDGRTMSGTTTSAALGTIHAVYATPWLQNAGNEVPKILELLAR
ncbi:MAG TPA: hypothetical protein VGB52_09450 [Actinomycetota bacterium]